MKIKKMTNLSFNTLYSNPFTNHTRLMKVWILNLFQFYILLNPIQFRSQNPQKQSYSLNNKALLENGLLTIGTFGLSAHPHLPS